MDHQRIPPHTLHWEVPEFRRGPGRLRTNWRSTVNKDLLRTVITCEEAEVAAQNRSEGSRSVAQCIHLDAGQIKVIVKVTEIVCNSVLMQVRRPPVLVLLAIHTTTATRTPC